MDMSSQIAFERAWAKANRLPQEERAIAPTGLAAYAHGVAEGEVENKAEGFALDMAAREAAQQEQGRQFGLSAEEKGRQFGLSTGEKGRQATTSLETRYAQAIKTLDERERQFGGSIEQKGRHFTLSMDERERQFGGRLAASASQFDRRLAAEKDIAGMRLGESSYESIMSTGQKMTQFEQELAFKAKKFDDEIAWMRDKFSQTLSFSDQVFADKMARQRRDLDTWILNNRIGSVVQLGNTIISAYGHKKAIDERKAINAELNAARSVSGTRDFNRAYDLSVNTMIDEINSAYKTPKYEFDPNWEMTGKYLINPNETGVTTPLSLADFAKGYDRMKVTPQAYRYLSP